MHRIMLAVVLSGLIVGIACPVRRCIALEKPVLEPNEVRKQPTELEKVEGLEVKRENYPRTSGSTSAEPLGIWVACRLLGLQCEWPKRHHMFSRERRLFPTSEEEKKKQELRRFYVRRIRHRGTHGSYEQLITGQQDLIYECRLPSEDERKLMKQEDVELEYTPIALDAFVFLRHKDNPVKGLTSEQIRDMYTRAKEGSKKGRITNWKQVGGPAREIHPYVRNRNSGSQETMLSLVMKDRTIVGGESMIGHSMTGPYNKMGNDPAGIGFTFYYYQRYMSPLPRRRPRKDGQQAKEDALKPPVRMLAIDGVRPTRKNIARRKYIWVTEVYVVTRKDLKDDHRAAKLREWLLTEEGQSVIGETGYVPISQAAKKPQADK